MSRALEPEELRRYEKRLKEDLAALDAGVAEVREETLEPSGAERFQDVDESIEEAGLGTELGVLAARDEIGYELREALDRMAQGTYGVCESCGAPIERERLDEVPYARLCERCARQESAARS